MIIPRHQVNQRRLVALATTMLSVLVLVVATSSAPSASGQMARSCLGAPGDVDQDQGEEHGAAADQMRGIRSDVFAVESAECSRISSLYLYNELGTSIIEFGYRVGFSGDTEFGDTCEDSSFDSNPVTFVVWVRATGTSGCQELQTLTGGVFHSLEVSDLNADSNWRFFVDGDALIRSVAMDFRRGRGGANVERGNANDGGYAEFKVLSENLASSGWTFFDDLQRDVNVGNEYVFKALNEHHGKVVLSS